jgi:transitional endoplasmic reticulum ATPase
MSDGSNDADDTLRILSDAVRASPDNVNLRRHLASLFAKAGRNEEAVEHYREALRLGPDDAATMLALARCYAELGRDSHALVVLETLLSKGNAPAAAYLAMARLAKKQGDATKAAHHYREAVDADPTLRDADLEEGLLADPGDEAMAMTSDGGDGAGGEGMLGVERPKIDFSDVGGMQHVKSEIEIKVIQPLLHPEMFKAYGKKVGGGILLYGPPGCGKTHLARATAGQVKAGFFAVGLSDVLDMWIGNSEKQLHSIFEQARRQRPFVLFFDEVDALAANRGDLRHSGARTLVNQFLDELDGARGDNDGLLILAATNAPWHLDSAFRRPGRFDRILFVPPPDEAARAAILTVMLRDKPTDAIDVAKVAKATEHMSGADLKGVIDVAIEEKLREALRAGGVKPLTTKDLLAAAKQVKPSTREWFATARNHVLYANQGGQYDDVKKYLGM